MVTWQRIDIAGSKAHEIQEFLAKTRTEGNYAKGSTVGGWSSKNYILAMPFLEEMLREVQDLVSRAAGIPLQYRNYFFNINTPGSHNKPHVHVPLVKFSSVVYLQVPENSGALFWEQGHKMPEVGDVAIFPQDMLHWTGVNESAQDRVCLVINFF